MVTLLASLVYELLSVMKYNICILLRMHVGTTHIFTSIKFYYINIDRGGVT
jgi:hypothetical protein